MLATVNTGNSSPVASGSVSIAVKTPPHGAFQFNRLMSTLDTTLSKSLSFKIHGGETGGQKLKVVLMKDGLGEGSRLEIASPQANAWTTCTLSLRDLGMDGIRTLNGLRIIEVGGVESTYYLDEIKLTGDEAPSLAGSVFDDVCRTPWFNNPFAATVDVANGQVYQCGTRSMAVTITGGGGCAQLNYTSGDRVLFNTVGYDALSFWIHGGTTGGQKLHLSLHRNNAQGSLWTIPEPQPNTWVKHTVPLSTLGAENATDVNAIWFRDANTGKAQPVFYLDDIRFEAASGATPASAAAPAAPLAANTAAPAVAQKTSPALPPGVAPQGTKVTEGIRTYPYAPYQEGKMDPQTSGWPLTPEEEAYVLKPEHDRRPGREANQHKPAMWPVTPSAGNWGGRAWLETHAGFVRVTQANPGPLDILLVGDSITMQWGGVHQHNKPFNAPWQKHLGQYRALNIGIGGDKTQNVLWRLDHGSVAKLEPKVCVLMIGNNNMFFTPETGIEPAALGVKACLDNLRAKFPTALVVLAKILPAGAPTDRFYQDMKRTHDALDALKLDTDPQVQVIDMWADFTHADGTLKTELFTPDKIHLNDAGYEVWATTMKPIVEKILGGKSVGKPINPPAAAPAPVAKPGPTPAAAPAATSAPASIPAGDMLKPTPKTADGKGLVYPYAPYNEGKMDPQITGWPLTDAEKAWIARTEYTRKPGHETQKHLPNMWFVTPTAARWGGDAENNEWIAHHAAIIEKVQAAKDGIDIALLGDSITQHWGGGWDGVPFNAAWQKHFGGKQTVNLGIGGDRMENILWRLDHGALDGTSPKVIVLKIGVNNAPLVFANGAPAATAAHAIKLCVDNLRMRCPKSQIVLVKILPALDPTKEAGKAVVDINACLDFLKLDQDPQVHILDLWKDFTNADGTLKTELYSDKHLHLGDAGYEAFAARLKPVVDDLIN